MARYEQYKTRWPSELRTYATLQKVRVKNGDVARGESLIAGKVGGNYSFNRDFSLTDETAFEDIIESLASAENLGIVKGEVEWMVKNHSLATSPSLLCALEIYFAEEMREKLLTKLTCKTVLMTVLKEKFKQPLDESEVIAILENLKKIIDAVIPHNIGSVTQYMSDIRVHVLRHNFEPTMLNHLRESGVFEQEEVDKRLVRAQQRLGRINRATRQVSVSYNALNALGKHLVLRTESIIANEETKYFRLHMMHQLIATVMLATGSRLTEVVILSDYVPAPRDSDIRSRTDDHDDSHFLTITPVAKRKDPDLTKTSDRVILFDLSVANIRAMVTRIRILADAIQEQPGSFAKLDKTNADDRARAIRMIGDFSGFVTDVCYDLNKMTRFTPRALRGLYAIMSYNQKAIKPTSSIVWINAILGHALMSTSVHYNVYALY